MKDYFHYKMLLFSPCSKAGLYQYFKFPSLNILSQKDVTIRMILVDYFKGNDSADHTSQSRNIITFSNQSKGKYIKCICE